jgi:hypothetical protein
MEINADSWLENAKGAGWQSGLTHPESNGFYERLFTDGKYINYWNGRRWYSSKSNLENDRPHWRQVGDYPCWRKSV